MSLRALTHVWRNSTQRGSGLLLHLALADFSDDSGESFPSIPTLAVKARIGERHVQRLLKKLVETGELSTRHGQGPRGTHLFKLEIGATKSHPDNLSDGPQVAEGVTFDAPGGVVHRSQKPSVRRTIKEPSSISRSKPANHDPRINPLITSFSEKYQTKSGRPYPPTWGKDKKSLKRLLTAGESPESITAAMDLYFASEWHAERGFDIATFCSSFSSLVSKSNGKARGKFPSVAAAEGKYAKFS